MSVATGPRAEPYPRFSDVEMARRRDALAAAMVERDVGHALIYGADRAGTAVGWLTRWPVTREALVVHTPDEEDLLLVSFYNHVPNARRLATEARVEWAGPRPVEAAVAELRRRGAGARGVGVIGPLGHRAGAALAAGVGDVVDLSAEYVRLRLVKSREEIDWLRVGCELTDRAIAALARDAAPGIDERALGDIVERAYVAAGATTHIHYFAATAMDSPEVSVPAQWPSTRALRAGDALTCEISASFWDHPGQVLRTFAVDAEPPPLFRRLHEVADAAFDALFERLRPGATAADLVEASTLIGDAGFTTRDDLVHGFVGGYLPPVLGDASRTLEPVPDFAFRAGMTVVLQPNVITRDERAGVQTGELVLVAPDGAERLHSCARGFLTISAASPTASTIGA
jgi:Xaa-Pro dipeptidase